MKQKGLIVSSDNLLSSYKDLSDIEFVIIRLGFTDFNTKKTKHIDSKFYENYELSKKEKLKIFITRYQAKEAKEQIQYYRKGKMSEEERNILKEMEIRIDQLDFDEAEILMKRWEGME